ncbi:MAG: hypothetical protein KDD63_15365, partial [Bacteroidetes bacterium]|nr:hypothetical protein [Bacteroidota bacterium]
LWYAQEVEGIRTDVRVLCLSYVNTDWYIDQMYQKVNDSEPLPLNLKRSDYQGQSKQSRSFGDRTRLPIQLPADGQSLLNSGIIYESDMPFVEAPMKWNVPTRGSKGNKYLELKDILILNLLENVSKNDWERPVYFANTVTPSSFLGLDDYLRLEGLAYRILPVKKPKKNDPYDPFSGDLDLERMDKNMTAFRYRNLDKEGMYYDENIIRMLGNYYNTFYRLGNGYLREAEELEAENSRLNGIINGSDAAAADSARTAKQNNDTKIASLKAKALESMNFADEKFPVKYATPDPYMIVRNGLIYDRLGEIEKANEYFEYGKERSLGTLKYYTEAGGFFPKSREYMFPLQMLQQYYRQKNDVEKLTALTEEMNKLDPRFLKGQ